MDEEKFRSGDHIKVHTKIKEGDKTRTQIFPGMIIAMSGSDGRRSLTVRRRGKDGVFVERIFTYPSPWIEKIEIVKQGKVRRAKLYFVRKKNFSSKSKYLQL